VSAYEQCTDLVDMVFFQGKIYAIGAGSQDLLAMDIVHDQDNGKPRVSRIECIIEGEPLPLYFHQMVYLLESHGTLLMIRRTVSYARELMISRICPIFVPGNNEFEVFKADFGCSRWTEMSSLGADLALFLGRGCSKVVRVSPYELSQDCIFFVDDYIDDWYLKKTTISCGVYDMKDRKVYSSLPPVSWLSGKVPATWLFSQGTDCCHIFQQ
jgi:hypothetical protein